MRIKRIVYVCAYVLLVVGVLAAAPRAWAGGEQVGRIRGVITDTVTKAPMAGATVTVRGPALIGGPQTVIADDGGKYEAVNLPPGTYVVEVVYPGVKPTTRRISVRQGEAVPLDISYSAEMAGVETELIVEHQRITKPDSTQTGTVLNYGSMSQVATNRTYQGIAQQVPGVSGGANPNIKGGLSIQNRYLVDGLDITDPVTGTFSTNLTFDSIGSVEVLTGGMEAQYNSLGGVINVITAQGSDEWHANASLYFNHQDLSASTPVRPFKERRLGNYGSNTYDGFQPFNQGTVGPNQSYQVNANVGGPIISQKLWLNASYELRLTDSSTVKGPPLGIAPYNIQHPARSSVAHLLRLKLNWAASARDRVSLSANGDPAYFNNVGGGNKNAYLGIAETRQNQGGEFVIGQWDHFFSQGLNSNVQAGFQINTIEAGPQGQLGSIDNVGCEMFSAKNCVYDPMQARHVNLVDNSAWYNGSSYQWDRRWTGQLDPSVSVRGHAGGYHDAKIGLQTRYNYRSFRYHLPGSASYTDNGGGPLESGLCDEATGNGCFLKTETPDFSTHEAGYAAGLYLQDRWWTPLSWLTIAPGVRFDYGHTADRKGRTVSSLFGIGPRIGAIVDITGDAKNIFSVFYGRSNEVLSLLPAANFDSSEAAVTNRSLYAPGMGFQPLDSGGGPGGVLMGTNLTPPHTDEVTASYRREIFESSTAGIEYTYKKLSNIWDYIEINQIWDPTGTRVVGYVDPMKPNMQVQMLATPADNYRKYQGLDFFVEGRPTPHWDFFTAYTLGFAYGPGYSEFDQVQPLSEHYNPRQYRFFSGFLPEDVRHQLKLRVSHTSHGLTVGGYLTYATGGPVTKAFYNNFDGGYTNFRSPIGTEPGTGNDPKKISEFRLPDILQTDIRFAYNLLPGSLGQRLSLIADVFNIMNVRTPTALGASDVATTYGQVLARQAPLRVQVALNYMY